jgi:aryl sulfotransferase
MTDVVFRPSEFTLIRAPRLIRPATRHVRSRLRDSAAWDDFPMRRDDILIATYAKCGTTWMQRIVGMLVFGSAKPFPVQESSPWPDFRIAPPGAALASAQAQSHRRFLKSHLPFDALPFYEGVKYIHVARDGRDAAMSYFNHKTNYTPEIVTRMREVAQSDPKFRDEEFDYSPQDPVAHFSSWVEGPEDEMGDPGASYFVMEKSFWAARHEPNVLLVHYNDLKADRAGEMRRIAAFLDIEVAEADFAAMVEAAGFTAMKAASAELLPSAGGVWKGGAGTFVNKGTNGRWKEVFDPLDLARYDAKVECEFSPSLAAWCEHGRLIAGDPRALPD